MRHYASRGLLAVLSAFIAITAIAGALLVVPTLPIGWLDGSLFADYTIPALALGFVGGLAVVTFVLLVIRPEQAGMLAVVTGLAMIVFELVEIWVVGFSLVEYGIEEPVAWLQVVYLVVGALTAGAGLGLWRASDDDRERLARTSAATRWTVHD
jgi:hypothetical protein